MNNDECPFGSCKHSTLNCCPESSVKTSTKVTTSVEMTWSDLQRFMKEGGFKAPVNEGQTLTLTQIQISGATVYLTYKN